MNIWTRQRDLLIFLYLSCENQIFNDRANESTTVLLSIFFVLVLSPNIQQIVKVAKDCNASTTHTMYKWEKITIQEVEETIGSFKNGRNATWQRAPRFKVILRIKMSCLKRVDLSSINNSTLSHYCKKYWTKKTNGNTLWTGMDDTYLFFLLNDWAFRVSNGLINIP